MRDSSFFSKFVEEHHTSIILLLLLISVIGGLVGFRYYKHTKEDPEFCMSCHMMQDAFKTWQKSKHRDFTCQKCHLMSLLEQNKMLISYVVKGPTGSTSQTHGRVSPWDACRSCHLSEVAQGSLTLNKSYGHAKHVFMQKINCSKCHTGSLHMFQPNEQACTECHKDKVIHGMGMEGMSCLKCHNYSEREPMMISTEKCMSCHRNIPAKGVMATLKCFDCHHPHGKIKPTSQDCLKTCHGNEANVGQHNLHMTRAKMSCLDCHKAHTWTVGRKEAGNLCNRCHKLKDPATFIY